MMTNSPKSQRTDEQQTPSRECWRCHKTFQVSPEQLQSENDAIKQHGSLGRIVTKRQCDECNDFIERAKKCEFCREKWLPPRYEPSCWFHYWLCSERCAKNYLVQQLDLAGVPPRYVSKTFETFDLYNPHLRQKLDKIQSWSQSNLRRSILLTGGVGVGKSHLSVAAIRQCLMRRKSVRYANGRQFILNCQSSFGRDETVEEIVDDLLSGSVLVLDDVASEKITDFGRQSLLHLVDEAYVTQSTLFVTTNLNLKQLSQIEPRLASRLAEMCDVVVFEAEDYRVRLAERRAEPYPQIVNRGAA
jgi:DNA replication protein DnaC